MAPRRQAAARRSATVLGELAAVDELARELSAAAAAVVPTRRAPEAEASARRRMIAAELADAVGVTLVTPAAPTVAPPATTPARATTGPAASPPRRSRAPRVAAVTPPPAAAAEAAPVTPRRPRRPRAVAVAPPPEPAAAADPAAPAPATPRRPRTLRAVAVAPPPEPVGAPAPAPAPPAPRSRRPLLAAVALPPAAAAEAAPLAAAVGAEAGPAGAAASATPLSPRPWTAARAAEPVQPIAPPANRQLPARHEDEGRSWVMSVITGMAVAVALTILVASRLDLASTAAPPLSLNGLAVVRDPSTSTTLAEGHVPATAREIQVAVDYVGAQAGDRITFAVAVEPSLPGTASPAIPPAQHVFSPPEAGSGKIIVGIDPTGGAFVAGTYTVTATHDGHLLREATVVVDAPPAPAPTAAATSAAAPPSAPATAGATPTPQPSR